MSHKKETRNEGVLKSFKKTKNLSEVAREYNLAVSTVYEIINRKRVKNLVNTRVISNKKLST